MPASNGVSESRKEGGEEKEEHDARGARSFIVRSNAGGGLVDLVRFLLTGDKAHEFLEIWEENEEEEEAAAAEEEEEEHGLGPIPGDYRWVILVSIVLRRIIAFVGKPMQWIGVALEFFLNLVYDNGGFRGLFLNLLKGDILVPLRGSITYISVIGHLDMRINLHKLDASLRLDNIINEIADSSQVWSRTLMDLCMMASKLAYENANVVKYVVDQHWKMHFVEFYNCWNDYQKEKSTQVFILCDKPVDASIVLISFRGTEPFDKDDWSTDVDLSWYQIPQMGKVHMGFLEALGLGNRAEVSTFKFHLQQGHNLNPQSFDTSANHSGNRSSINSGGNPLLEKDKMNAYYAVKTKLESLLQEHKKAKFIVTGHSLGGALAILFPAVLLYHREEELMKRLLGVYTFGQPRVGDDQLVRFMKAHISSPIPKYFRVVYCNDLVPRLPYDDKTFLYKHFGLCLYYNSLFAEQVVEEEPNRNYFGVRYLLPCYLNAVWELIRSLIMGYMYGADYKETWFSVVLRVFGLLMIPGISAHSPANYVNSIRLGRGVLKTGCT